MNSSKHPFKLLAEVWPSRGYAACDGPLYLRWSVLQVRHNIQRINFDSEVTQLVTVRRLYDGPSCSSVVKFRELIPVPKFQSWSVLERIHMTDRRAYEGFSYLPLRVMKGATWEFHKCGTTESMTVHHDHDGPSRDPSTQSVFTTNDSTARND